MGGAGKGIAYQSPSIKKCLAGGFQCKMPVFAPLIRQMHVSERMIGLLALLAPVFAGTTLQAVALESHPGKAIYERLCVDCHAPNGEGVEDKADDPLAGSRSLDSLADRIERTMPEDEEHLCAGGDARKVAEYIYHAFYSAEARSLKTPARIDLVRLTVPQYRNSVADLILGFRGKIQIGDSRGLAASYFGDYKYNERQERKDEKRPDRFEFTDPLIKQDFGEGIPGRNELKGFSPERFSIRWAGSILPEETGHYEFVIRTRNGVRLWVNETDEDSPKTIDGWVAPSNEIREERGSAFLLGGRPYPLRLDFFKYKEKAAFIELLWKTPHGVLETVPTRNLLPERGRESLSVASPFPADDRSVGYERGTTVSRAWLDAVTAGAIDAGDYVVEHLDELARTNADDPERGAKLVRFAEQFLERAFRRPLSREELNRFAGSRFEETETGEQAVKRTVLFALTSPRFLYPGFGGNHPPDKWEAASRLSLALWDSLPTLQLLERLEKGQFDTPRQIEITAGQMVSDWRTRAKMRGFFHHWLELERGNDLAKDKKVYPEFNEAVLSDLRTSLNLFIDEAVWSKGSSFEELMLADYLFLNERLGRLYGQANIKGGFQKVPQDPKRRTGIITHPFLLASLAYHNNTSPIHRGVFLTRNIVGMTLKSPPMANEFKEGKFDPTFTMREKVTEMTRAKACMGCHVTINPLGFSLEHYDGIGRWRNKDQDSPVNATSKFTTESGETIQLTGARDVAEFAVGTPSAHRAFIQQLFHHMLKQPAAAYGEETVKELQEDFAKAEYSIPELIRRIALRGALADYPSATE
jgi:hypothetical protein